MNNLWKVKVLVLGHHTLDKSGLTHNSGVGQIIDIPLISVAIYNDEHNIVVDTGQHDAKWVTEHMLPATTTPEEEMPTILKNAMGWELDDVDTVINTHLHFDHCGNNKLFKKAKFVVDKREWEYGFDPLPHQRRLYMPELFDTKAVNFFDWKFVEGDTELYPGIYLLSTPGHTPGHLSVLVNTEEGTLCIAGDVCNMVENINNNVVSNLVISPEQMLHSLKRMRWASDVIIPGHDPIIKQYQTGDFPKVNKENFL